ncbi:MAG: hypothetical protein ACRBBQ_10595 [Cognatishimia sp.]
MSDFHLNELASICRELLRDEGYTIRPVEDFNLVRKVADILGKPYLTPKLSPFMNDFTPQNCFWLLLEKDNEVIAAGGCRFDDLGDMKLSQFWKNNIARNYMSNSSVISDVAKPVDEALTGKLVYFGDLIIEKKNRGRATVLRRFTHFAQAFAMLKFSPDFSYAFVRERDAGRGAMGAYGFNTIIHSAQRWQNAPEYHRDDDAVLYVDRRYFSYYAQLRCQSPEKL